MVECARHVNLVKVPSTDGTDNEAVIGSILSECDSKQRALLKQLVSILEEDRLSRLACASVSYDGINDAGIWILYCNKDFIWETKAKEGKS